MKYCAQYTGVTNFGSMDDTTLQAPLGLPSVWENMPGGMQYVEYMKEEKVWRTFFKHFLSCPYGTAEATQRAGKPSRSKASRNSWANFILE
jgi:hypothetical protein